jgi:hypothetical protein
VRVPARAHRQTLAVLPATKPVRLPGRKSFAANERVFDVVLIDMTGTPIERPKKTKALSFR